MAVNAGFLNGADLSVGKHSVYYAWSPYRDPWRRALDSRRLERAVKDTREVREGIHLGDQALVFEDIKTIAGSGDYRVFAAALDEALKKWGIIPEGTGLVNGALVSDTGELAFDPDNARFSIRTPYCGYFSGAPEETVSLSDDISAKVRNQRISMSLLPVGQKNLKDAKEYLLTAMGNTGMDETVANPGPQMMGIPLTVLTFAGKLYAETLEGNLYVKARDAVLQVLSPVGEVLAELTGEKSGDTVCFALNGEVPGIQYRMVIK